MCSSKSKLVQQTHAVNLNASTTTAAATTMVSDINGRPVLQPAASNRVLTRCSPKKNLPPPPPLNTSTTTNAKTINKSPVSPPLTKCSTTKTVTPVKKLNTQNAKTINKPPNALVVKYSSAAIVDAPGSIAAARREQVAVMQVQRKMKIAHYGRSKSAKYDSCSKFTSFLDLSLLNHTTTNLNNVSEEKRCSFITLNSDPVYVAYHDEEWGVPVHDDKLLFELLVLTGAQVGSDWTSVLKKRQKFREAFSGFEADIVAKFTDMKITTMSSSYGIDAGFIRAVVDNSNCILEIKKAFGSFDKYVWGFLNHKPIQTNYKPNQKMPVRTSKSEAISRDMVRRGFRQVGPTVIHSFMQAAGLTNDHLTTCSRHNQCVAPSKLDQHSMLSNRQLIK